MRNNKSILLVEDDEVDVITIKRALKELNITNPVDIAGNGEEALEFLQDPNQRKPCLILLDLNMPKMGGLELLAELKKDDDLSMIPVVVLTTSREEQDRVASFKMNVAGYMLKPVDYKQFVEVVKTIELYWTLSELPPEH